MMRGAIERRLGIIGEAFSQLRKHDPGLGARIEDFEAMIAMRHRLVHDYIETNDNIARSVVTFDIPALLARLEELLSEPP